MLNVHDELKEFTEEEIQNYVEDNTIKAYVALYNVTGNLNLGSIIRTANFLGFEEVLYFGRRKWDRRGAVGQHHYTKLSYFSDEEAFLSALTDRSANLVALENNVCYDVERLDTFVWPENPCIILGEEGHGLTERILENARVVEIPGKGSVRSLNVSAAAAIAMSDYSIRSI